MRDAADAVKGRTWDWRQLSGTVGLSLSPMIILQCTYILWVAMMERGLERHSMH